MVRLSVRACIQVEGRTGVVVTEVHKRGPFSRDKEDLYKHQRRRERREELHSQLQPYKEDTRIKGKEELSSRRKSRGNPPVAVGPTKKREKKASCQSSTPFGLPKIGLDVSARALMLPSMIFWLIAP